MIELDKIFNKTKFELNVLGKVSSTEAISTDTRSIRKGDIFLALYGENFDGNNYLEKAISLGAQGCIYTSSPERDEEVQKLSTNNPDIFFIGVNNTEKYFQDLSKLHHEEWRKSRETLTIGITGSNGKTTTKELLAGILEKLFPEEILFTSGNLNNHLGLPMTLLRLNSSHRVCILEMGTNHPGEIPFLCSLGDPEAGIITNIGQSHLEFFETEENVFKEKRSLFDYVIKKKGSFSVDGDNKFLKKLKNDKLSSVGFSNGNIRLELNDTNLKLLGDMNALISAPRIFGKHNFKNLALCTSLLFSLYPDKKNEIIQACVELELPDNNRSQFIKKKDKNFFLDAYNANPSSMMASIETFLLFLEKESIEIKDAVFVLGDMNELGDKAPEYHEKIGELLKNYGAVHTVFVGRYSKYYKKGFGENSQCYESTKDLQAAWNQIVEGYSAFILKGSRTLQLESLMAQI